MQSQTSNNGIPVLRTLIRLVLLLACLMALLFIPAGTLNWPQAWIFLILYFISVTTVGLWLKKNDPELLKERMNAHKKKNVKSWDRVIVLIFTLLTLILFAVAGLDAVRLGWSHVSLAINICGFLGFLLAMGLVFWTMKENTYLSELVRIQEERGHTVVTTGPYEYVRHPMYVGVTIFLLSIPLALGSLYALIPAVLSVILLFIRTAIEDKTLHNELEGYREYAQTVRYKMVPGIW